MSKDSADYDIGYGKPPEYTRFKKGQSGNPRGRPKKQPKDVAAHMADLLDEKQTVRMNGKTVVMTGDELMARRLMEKAMKGDAKAFEKVHQLKAQHLEAEQRRADRESANKEIVVKLVHAKIPEEECYKKPGERILYHEDGEPSVIETWDGYLPDEDANTEKGTEGDTDEPGL
jgi:Family of unknown function (DUF5681)